MLIDTPGGVEAMAEVLNEPDCPVVIKDGHFVEKPISSKQKIQCIVDQIDKQNIKSKPLELTSDKNLNKSKDDVNIKTNSKSVSSLKTLVPVKESLNTMNVKTKIKNLKDGEVVTLTQHDIPDFPYLKIRKNPKFDNMYILWNENADGEVINKVNFSSFNNTVYWAEKCDDAFLVYYQPEKINESMNNNYNGNDTIDLEYEDLPIIVYEGGSSSGRFDTGYGNWLPDEGIEKEIEIDYTYTITKDEALEVIQDILYEQPTEEIKEMSDEELTNYLESNFDDLFDTYEEQIKEHFADAAAEKAKDENYLYESAPTKDYFDRKYEEVENVKLKDFWDDVKEEPKVEEDYDLIDTNLELEGLDANDPEIKVTDYEWTEEDPEATPAEWEEVASKNVFDSDGFLTDYVWYTNGDKHIFVFGDSAIYKPEDGDFDWEIDVVKGKEAEAYKEAQEWFNSYKGFEDEDLDLEVADFNDSIPEDAYQYNDDVVDHSSYFEEKPVNESAMSDLDIEAKELGGNDVLAEKIEKHIAALQSELEFLLDVAPREVGAGGNFDSQKEIDEAVKATEEQLHKEQAKLSVLRRGK